MPKVQACHEIATLLPLAGVAKKLTISRKAEVAGVATELPSIATRSFALGLSKARARHT